MAHVIIQLVEKQLFSLVQVLAKLTHGTRDIEPVIEDIRDIIDHFLNQLFL